MGYVIISVVGFLLSFALLFFFLKDQGGMDQRVFYLILILFGIATSAIVFGLMNTHAVLTGKEQNWQLKMTGPGVGVVLVVLGGIYLIPNKVEQTITIRVYDWKQRAVTDGEVKLYLDNYIRTQQIDKMGQAQFVGIPEDRTANDVKIEISSPGYASLVFDTLLVGHKPLELILPLTPLVFISGRVKTAAEVPIAGVEVVVEGTRYYAISKTDGTYKIRLEEYTLGDEVALTTSHKDFEDKTFSLKIDAPDMEGEDIFLNPIAR